MTPSASRAPSVCIVVNDLDPRAGWGRQSRALGSGFERRGWRVGYVAQEGGSGPQVLNTPLRDLSFFKLLKSLWRIRKFVRDYDILFCYDANPYGILVTIASLGLGKNVVIHALGTYSLFTTSRLRNALIGWTYRRVDAVFIVSDFVRRQIEKSGFRFAKYVMMPVGVEVARFQKTANRPEKPPYLVTVGRVKSRKGHHLTVAAFIKIAGKYPSLRYVIVGKPGNDAYGDDIRRMIAEAGLEHRIVFRTDVGDDELVGLYSGAELFMMTSVTEPNSIEGFGMVYLEAGSCGLPVIGARDSGAEAAIVDDVTGLLVEHDSADIARAISEILDDPAKAKAMGQAGMEHAKQFDWEKVVDLHLVEFRKLLNPTAAKSA